MYSQDIPMLSDRNLRLYKQVLVIIITDHVISILEVIESLVLVYKRRHLLLWLGGSSISVIHGSLLKTKSLTYRKLIVTVTMISLLLFSYTNPFHFVMFLFYHNDTFLAFFQTKINWWLQNLSQLLLSISSEKAFIPSDYSNHRHIITLITIIIWLW